MKYLIVVAHPDDEVLGAGASIWKWIRNGDTVDVCIMCTEAKASPRLRMNLDLRNSASDQSQRMLNAIEPDSPMPIHRHRKT